MDQQKSYIRNISNFSGEIDYFKKSEINYRNKLDVNLSDLCISNIHSQYALSTFKFLKHINNKYYFGILSLKIKENSNYEAIISLSLDNNNISLQLYKIANLLYFNSSKINYKLLNISIFYKDNLLLKYNFYSKNLIEKYGNIVINIDINSFSRINFNVASNIYEYFESNLDNCHQIIFMGRDVEVPSKIAKKYSDNIVVISQKKIIENFNHECDYQYHITPKNNYFNILKQYQNNHKIIFISSGRKGLGIDLINILNKLNKINRLIIVSCNQQTLKEDIKMLSTTFRLTKIKIFDEHANTEYFTTILIFQKL